MERGFVEIEYLDGVRSQVKRADVKLLINKNNGNKRKYAHYWTPSGETEPNDFLNMGSLTKFKANPMHTRQRGLYYCKIIEKAHFEEVHFADTQDASKLAKIMATQPTVFAPEESGCPIGEVGRNENNCIDTSNTWNKSNGYGKIVHYFPLLKRQFTTAS